ncbi:MAG: TIM barrel protein [Anaerolineaceae bacterium]|nr:TIM barrel protein [Anaerolineaceae bacterium]
MKDKVYSQVYSILKTSREGVLEAIEGLAKIGWDGIEAMGTNTGGLSKQEFHTFIDDLGIKIISFHGLRDDEDREFAQEFGAKFTDVRPAPELLTIEDCKRSADDLTKQCDHLSQFGLVGIVHNHAAEFRHPVGDESKTLYDFLMDFTDPDLVKFELDIGWAQLAGVDCGALIRKYSGRFPVLHVKECDRLAQTDDELDHFPKKVMAMMKPQSAPVDDKKFIKGAPQFTKEQMEMIIEARSWNNALGKGLVDWEDVKAAAEAQPGGCDAYISEREYFGKLGAERDPMLFAKEDYEFLRAL